MADTALSERDWQIYQGRVQAEDSVGARLLYPATLDGPGVPCTCSPLTNAARLRAEGGGTSLFDDALITLRADALATRPGEQQPCKLKVGTGESWRAMRIESVTVLPGGNFLQLNLNSEHQNA